jgi:hypothetical protein
MSQTPEQKRKTLERDYNAHQANITRITAALPTLKGQSLQRAENTIQNLRQQMLDIDKQLLRTECSEVAA